MPKTLTPVQQLEESIGRLESEIKDKLAQIENQEHQNREFEQSMRLLSAGAGQLIPAGQLAPLDALNQLLMDADSEKERQAKWSLANQALRHGRESVTVLQGQIQLLRQELTNVLTELDWQSNYAPYADKYRDGCPFPSPEQKQQRQIVELHADINEKKRRLKSAQDWIAAPNPKSIYYGLIPGSQATQDIPILEGAITTLEKNLDSLRNSEPRPDPDYQRAFRTYVKARFKAELPLSRFMSAQAEYLVALEELKRALAPELGVQAPDLPRIIRILDGRIVVD